MADGEAPPTPPALRASDAERERTATLLRNHAAAGRLTPEELDERVEAAYGARTVGELDVLFHDLPAQAAVADPAGAAPAARTAAQEAARRRVLHVVGQSLLIVATAVAIWLASGADASFWPKWVIFLTAIRVAFRAWAELGPAGRARGAAGHEAHLGRGGVRPRELPREQPDER